MPTVYNQSISIHTYNPCLWTCRVVKCPAGYTDLDPQNSPLHLQLETGNTESA